MTQEQLAREAGYGRTYIGLVESGVISPRWINIVRLANALDVPPTDVVQRATAPRREPPGDGQ
jgi:transcriptional regulator with XRE-family HTH domain